MILNMYIVPGQGQKTSDNKISMLKKLLLLRSLLRSFIMILRIVKGLEAKNHFLTIDKCHNSVINYRNLPINNPKRDILETNAYAKFE